MYLEQFLIWLLVLVMVVKGDWGYALTIVGFLWFRVIHTD